MMEECFLILWNVCHHGTGNNILPKGDLIYFFICFLKVIKSRGSPGKSEDFAP